MNIINKEEFEKINRSASGVSDWITRYTGFFIIGSGAVFLSIGKLDATGSPSYLLYSISFFTISVVTMIMLYLIFYKFESHNRFSGYAKCLTQEDMSEDLKKSIASFSFSEESKISEFESGKSIFLYDQCITMLRYINGHVIDEKIKLGTSEGVIDYSSLQNDKLNKGNFNIRFCDCDIDKNDCHNHSIDTYMTKIDEFFKKEPRDQIEKESCDQTKPKSNSKFIKDPKIEQGLKIFFNAIRGKRVDTRSWAYPVYVTQVYFILIFIELLISISCWAMHLIQIFEDDKNTLFFQLYISFLILSALIYIIFNYSKIMLKRYYNILNGFQTIQYYCDVFAMLRAIIFQKMHKISPDYIRNETNTNNIYTKYYHDKLFCEADD